MMISPNTMQMILLLGLLGMQVLAALYLRTRRLTFMQYLGWGLLVALIPALGSFLTILLRPGRPMIHTIRRRGRSMNTPLTSTSLLKRFALRFRLTKP
jgi:hypothetical protein